MTSCIADRVKQYPTWVEMWCQRNRATNRQPGMPFLSDKASQKCLKHPGFNPGCRFFLLHDRFPKAPKSIFRNGSSKKVSQEFEKLVTLQRKQMPTCRHIRNCHFLRPQRYTFPNKSVSRFR